MLQDIVRAGGAALEAFRTQISAPWTLYQIAIIALVWLFAWGLAKPAGRPIENWARSIKGNPALLRVIIAVMRRLRMLLFVAGLVIARTAIVASTWPSRAWLVSIVLSLALAWLVSSVASRLIHNRFLSRLIALTVFGYVALGIIGIRSDVADALDALALPIGDFRLSALFVLRLVALVTVFVWLAAFIGRIIDNRIAASEDLSPSLKVLSGKIIKIGLITAAGLIAISSAGLDLTALTIFSGAVGVGLGFGLQKVVSNFISGIIILADRSIKPGDTIQLGETFGWIRELRARFVSVITRDGREYLIPNEDLITQQVVNWSFSDRLVRLDVDFGVAYDSDPHEVTKLAIEAAMKVPRVLADRKPVCWMTAFGASSLDFKLRFWISDPQQGLTNVRGQVLLALWDSFKEHGVNIPFPHREILMRTPVTLRRDDGEEADGANG